MNAALAIWEIMHRQNIADVNEVGIGKTQPHLGNIFETFLLFTVYSKSIYRVSQKERNPRKKPSLKGLKSILMHELA